MSASGANRAGAFFRRLERNEQGAVAIIFALTLTIVMSAIGGAVDYGRWLSAQSKTLQAMDSAVLAAGRVLQLDQTNEAGALATAREYYERNKSNMLDTDNVTFSVSNGEVVVSMSASTVKTPFLSLVGVPNLKVNNVAQARLEVGANSGTHVEISLMLDTTGSMAGDKMVALKQAAIDLMNIVIWQDQTEYTSKIALVPFSEYVNVGRDAMELVTNYNLPGNSDNRTCVKERQGAKQYKDAKPNDNNGYFDYYTGNSACRPQAVLLPLTSNKQVIQNRINEMQPTGMTAGHLGTAWTWYTLSPKFKSVWPAASEPKPYAWLGETNPDTGKPKLMKIAVLMTDGEYNKKYSGDSSAIQARETCKEMKKKGITVYTVGFELAAGGEAYNTLKECATPSPNDEYFYPAADANALKMAFRDIALKIATLRIIK